MDKESKIKQKYSNEWSEIDFILQKLEKGRIYGYNGSQDREAGSLNTNATNLRKNINSLLYKIENNVPGDLEIFNEMNNN